jgi:hypothetical protein
MYSIGINLFLIHFTRYREKSKEGRSCCKKCLQHTCSRSAEAISALFAAPTRGGNTHISHESVPKSRFMTASPSREKPLVGIFTGFLLIENVEYGTRLLPSGRSSDCRETPSLPSEGRWPGVAGSEGWELKV